MANRSFSKNVQTLDHAGTFVRCQFTITAAGAILAGSVKGPQVLSVVHTGTGVFTITLADTFPAAPFAVHANCQQGTATQAQFTAQQVGCASSTGSTMVLNTTLASAPTTLADPASGIVIQVLAYFNNTTQPF